MEVRHDPGQRQEEKGGRDQVDEEDGDARALAPGAREPRQRIAGGHREQERDDDDRCADEERVQEPRRVVGVVEEECDVLCRRVMPEVPVEVTLGVVVDVR